MRARSGEIGWRATIDELRPFTQSLWLASSTERKLRFLRHLRPWWDVHRHRLASTVAARIAALRDGGRLRVLAGRTLDFAPSGGAVRVTWRPRGSDRGEHLIVAA